MVKSYMIYKILIYLLNISICKLLEEFYTIPQMHTSKISNKLPVLLLSIPTRLTHLNGSISSTLLIVILPQELCS